MANGADDRGADDTKAFEAVTSSLLRDQYLDNLRQQRIMLRAHVDDGRVFHTFLLAVRPDKDHLVIDQLTPPPEEGALARGTELRLSAKMGGLLLRFDTHVRARGEKDGEILYKLDYPERVERRQRRRFFRVPVPLDFDYTAKLDLGSRSTIEGEVADLSANGVAIRVEGKLPEDLQPEARIPQAHLQLDGLTLSSPLTIRNLRRINDKRWLLGCRFEALTPAQENQLNRVVATLERVYLQRQNR